MGAGLAIGLGIGQAVAGLNGSVIQGEYNKELQREANNFTREQSQNQIKYNVKQMEDLGLSPLMLFDHGNATSGGAGGGKIGAAAPNYGAGIIEGINTVGRLLKEDDRLDLEERRLDMMEKANENKFDFLNQQETNRNNYRQQVLSNQIKNNDPFKNHNQRTYTQEDYNNLWDKL